MLRGYATQSYLLNTSEPAHITPQLIRHRYWRDWQTSIGEARRNWPFSSECDRNEPYAESEFSSEIKDRLLLSTDGLLEAEMQGKAVWRCGAAHFIQEKQDLGTEQLADLLLDEVLAWSRDGTQSGRKTISQTLVIDIQGMGP
jgi:hypothetical protein